MFSNKDKVKERVEFLVQNPDISCLICKNQMYKPVGVSIVMTYKYDVKDIEIIYDKWFVEDFEDASKMNLQGCEHHDQLVKGSGVMVVSKKLGTFLFYGTQANDIVKACEKNRDLSRYMFNGKPTFQK